ncbi:glycosyltransferase family A protein, partial [Vibrio mediterranei]|uniref:glycosyltransferase family A protein n=1 Tax=Vibrio mediterranei TaxID=689 RepID=UPI001EFEE908
VKVYILKVSVIIPTVNRHESLFRLLNSIAKQSLIPDEIIIIEQGGVKFELDELPDALKNRVEVVYCDIKSTAHSRYIGYQKSKFETIVYFDDDIEVGRDYISSATNYLQRNPQCNAVGGVYVNKPYTEKNKYLTLAGRMLGIYSRGCSNKILASGWGDYVRGEYRNEITHGEWLFGCNMVFRRSALREEYFPKEMILWSFLDDLYLVGKLTRKTATTADILPQLSVVHHFGISSGAPSRPITKMRIVYRYLVWKELFPRKTIYNRLRFILGLAANLLLELREGDIKDSIALHYQSWKAIYYGQCDSITEANKYVLAKD